MPIPRPIIDLLQRIGDHPVGGELERYAFRTTAKLAALDFARVPGVVAVYLTGSWTRPASAAPGYSDIDFLLTVDVPTLESEMELRAALHAKQRRWNSVAKLFKHLDYVEQRDFETMRRGGNNFWIDADDRYVALAGRSDLKPWRNVHQHQATERLTSALMRWMRVSPVLSDPSFRRPDAITRRSGRRIIAALVAESLQVNANDRLDDLIALGRARLPSLAGFQELPASRGLTEQGLHNAAAAMRVVDELCDRYTRDFPPATEAEPAPAVSDRFDASVRRAGFVAGIVVLLPPPRDPIHAFILTDEPAEESVRRLHREWANIETPQHPKHHIRPILLSRSMWRAAGLMYPPPVLGEALAAHGSPWGRPPPLPARERDIIGIARTLDLFYRPRGRAFRVDRAPDATLRSLAADVFHVAPSMRAYRKGVAVGPLPPIPDRLDETELIARMRSFLDEERPEIEAALGIPAPGRS